MDFRYKKIIREIMDKEAIKRGFVFSSGRKIILTRPLAIYSRVINGKKQSFEIIEDLLSNNTIIFRVVGVEKKYHYTDEDSFKSCIQQIEDYMENDGYVIMGNNAQMHVFSMEDSIYVEENYKMIAEKYVSERNLLQGNVIDAIDIISKDLEELFGLDWIIAKERLIKLASALTVVLLHYLPGTYITRFENAEYYYVERIDGISIIASEAPMQLVYDAYIENDCETWLKEYVKEYID